ncbi:MAG: YebC/PmpR family DNA-binding transcriptional regulator [Bacteroidota bacterium]
MGRVFEKRKHKMFARYDRMAKSFTRIGKEIAIAVKQSGANPDSNPRLRTVIQNAKSVNMPKDRVDAAIKRASAKDASTFEEIVYEGYGPHGVAIVVETATGNPTRTVSNVRMHFARGGGLLGKTGSLDFLFERKGVFKIEKENLTFDEIELELIDYGLEDIAIDENEAYIYTSFNAFGSMAKVLDEKKIKVISAEKQRIPNNYIELNEIQQEDVMKLIESLEQDDDVQHVYHNLK